MTAYVNRLVYRLSIARKRRDRIGVIGLTAMLRREGVLV